MKYSIKVNLNEGERFKGAQYEEIATVEATSKADAERRFEAAQYGHPDGDNVNFKVDMSRYSGMKAKAFIE